MARQHVIADSQTDRWVGLGLVVLGAYVLYDAHEGRGKDRPFWMRLFGGWV